MVAAATEAIPAVLRIPAAAMIRRVRRMCVSSPYDPELKISYFP
jgi:hypothetical protein